MKKEERQLMEKYLMAEESFWRRLSYIIPDMIQIPISTNKVSNWIETEGTKLWKKRNDYTDAEYEREIDSLINQMIEFIKKEVDGSVYHKTAIFDTMKEKLRKELKRK